MFYGDDSWINIELDHNDIKKVNGGIHVCKTLDRIGTLINQVQDLFCSFILHVKTIMARGLGVK